MFNELAVFMNCDAIKQGYVLLTSETLCSFEKYKRYMQNCIDWIIVAVLMEILGF
jgi:hypothetical protein